MKKFFRALAVTATAVIAGASLMAFTACETDKPEVTITYNFNGTDYKVEYELSRTGAPATVRHFIELADAGYYNGTVIHDYQNSGAFLYGGGYVIGDDGELEEKDYWSEVKKLEENGNEFTQTVYTEDNEPLYTVYGEFKANGVTPNTKSYKQNKAGTLVMYYMDKGSDTTRVGTVRADGGSNNDGENFQTGSEYKYNSATSLFYTYASTTSRTDLDENYCAFGRTKDFDQLEKLITAVNDYAAGFDEEDPFFVEKEIVLNQHDPFVLVRDAKVPAYYSVPSVPITIVSVKVTKY